MGVLAKKAFASKPGMTPTPIRLSPRPFFNARMMLAMSLSGKFKRVRFFHVKVGRRLVRPMAMVMFKRKTVSIHTLNVYQDEFEQLRQIPELRDHVPPTTRVVTIGQKHGLLMTDLTENGKWNVISYNHPGGPQSGEWYRNHCFSNPNEVEAMVRGLKEASIPHYGAPRFMDDAFLIQTDPKTRKGHKAWIVDLGHELVEDYSYNL
jgi:hypothetical protein